jgi:acyl carrier protein
LESIINDYISRELVRTPEWLPLQNDTSLLDTNILDSLSLLKLVMFLEQQFGVQIEPEELIPEHFETVAHICAFIRKQQQMQASR